MKQYWMIYSLLWILAFPISLHSQNILKGEKASVIVDGEGVMRYSDNSEEIKGFGVNYTVPFAHAFRSAKKMGIDPLKAIDQDVYHFARLGFDLYRVHIWDTEISDTLGNLIFNEQLNAFDYLLKKLAERDINYILTPIAFWGGGWPEPDLPTPGFSSKYGKDGCLTNSLAIKAQENYLTQFMSHVNPYTGVAYKDDKRLLAMEISNEPHHWEKGEVVTDFINRMVKAVRKSGFKNPVFYNVSHSVHLAENYFDADIQGGTFQWYPTGLGYQKELDGNFLPNVDQYHIPFDDVIRKNGGAKIVYEFDAADIGKSYIYPAMARSFRTAGIQVATHFSYDPTFLADVNTEYNTHHMNLAYTPQKALSLKICSEVFHQVPLYQDYGSYPVNTTFDNFSVDDKNDLAILKQPEKFYYTNTTKEGPLDAARLTGIAGYGSSQIVNYDGTGAYFLDKIEDGVWRLEVMPDALIIENPYGRNSLDKKVATVQWNERIMDIKLDDLGKGFSAKPLNPGNTFTPRVDGSTCTIYPGVYILARDGIETSYHPDSKWNNIKLGEYFAPQSTLNRTLCIHDPIQTTVENEPIHIIAKIISPSKIHKAFVYYNTGIKGGKLEMTKSDAFSYEATINGDEVMAGYTTYYIVIEAENEMRTFPANKTGHPYQWDFYARKPYRIQVNKIEQPVYLFNAEEDWSNLSFKSWPKDSRLIPTDLPHESEYQIRNCTLYQPDKENLSGPVIKDFSIRHYVNERINHLRGLLDTKKAIVIKARSLDGDVKKVQIACVLKDGQAYGEIIELSARLEQHVVQLADLKKVNLVTLPRPYPTFLPYYFQNKTNAVFSPSDIEGIQINIGPGLNNAELNKMHNIGIVNISLE